ncbi:MAG: YfiH family protein [Chlamydiales bacterium]|jgi:YfiH family protein
MKRKKQGNVEWLEFELLSEQPMVSHGIFLRQGGVSTGNFSSLNLAYDLGDVPESVALNLESVRKGMGISKLVWAKQCHGTSIAVIDEKSSESLVNTDGFMTQTKGIASLVKHADCQAAIFYDPIHHAIANIHSGWRGSVQNIYAATIEAMNATYQSSPENILVCISPSLGPIAAEFLDYKKELPEHFWDFKNDSSCFNFWEISRSQLRKEGVLPHHIEIAELCTYSDSEDFFSYRRNKLTGRHGTVAMLL